MITVCIDGSTAPDVGSVQIIPCGTSCIDNEDCTTPCNYECDCYTFENTAETNKFLTIDECNVGISTYELAVSPFETTVKLCVRRGSTITVDSGIVYYLCSTNCITSGGSCTDCTTTTSTTTTIP
jgi:hypothetical protein